MGLSRTVNREESVRLGLRSKERIQMGKALDVIISSMVRWLKSDAVIGQMGKMHCFYVGGMDADGLDCEEEEGNSRGDWEKAAI